MEASRKAHEQGLKPGTSIYNKAVKAELDKMNKKINSPTSPVSPRSPLLQPPSSCIAILNGLDKKPELNGKFVIVKGEQNKRVNVIPIITSPEISVAQNKITPVSLDEIQGGGRKRKSRKNRRSKRTKHSRRTNK